MELFLNGHAIEAESGETLLSLIRRLDLDTDELQSRPLAAAMAGEVFTLNFVPVRAEERARRAVRRACGKIELLYYESAHGREVYERSLLFVFLLAVRKCFPASRVHFDYAVSGGVYASIKKDTPLTAADVDRIKAAALDIVRADHLLERQRLDIEDAVEAFANDGQTDKVELLEWRRFSYFDVYRVGDCMDYFYGEMLPSTGYVSVFDLRFDQDHGGVLILRPDRLDPSKPTAYTPSPKLAAVFRESEDWGRLMHCGVVAELNDMVRTGRIRELIRVNEALHEKRYAGIADEIVSRGAKAVLIAGPSSSGKTTSANRLATQLRVHGKTPILMSLDDYYIDRDKILPDENGELDLEHINTIDTDLFRSDLSRLLAGETVELPRFDFKTGRRVMDGHTLRLDADSTLIIEGLHGLNPALLPDTIDKSLVYRLYVSALTTLNLDDHNRISTAKIRLLRRMMRDYETRGASLEHTLSMWKSVRRGEERWIFPYQENADAIMNTTLVYELAVIKKHIFPMLMTVRHGSPYFEEVQSIIKFLNYVLEANVDDEIPPTSVLREFIGGNAFYR